MGSGVLWALPLLFTPRSYTPMNYTIPPEAQQYCGDYILALEHSNNAFTILAIMFLILAVLAPAGVLWYYEKIKGLKEEGR